MPDDFMPTFTSAEISRDNLVAKLQSIENERLQIGAELDALRDLRDNDRRLAEDLSFQAEYNTINNTLTRLDARLVSHRRALDRVGGEDE